MVTTEWFCQVMGSEVGPLSQRQLVDMVRQHRLNPEDLVRRNNSNWVPAFQVKGLFEAASKPAEQVRQSKLSSTVASKAEKSKTDANVETHEAQVDGAHAMAEKTAATKASPPPRDATASPPSSPQDVNDWFCIASGEKRGPLRFDQLKAMARNGTLRDRDRVWRASWPKFRQAAEVEGLEVT